MKAEWMGKLIAIAAGLVLLTASPAWAHGHHGCMGHHEHGGPIGFYLMNQDQLGLSKKQVDRLVALKMDFMKTKIMERAPIRVLHVEAMALMMHHNVNVKAVQDKVSKILAHKRKIMDAKVQTIAEAHRVLTAQQYQMVKEMWREMMRMHHGLMPHHPMMGHPAQSM